MTEPRNEFEDEPFEPELWRSTRADKWAFGAAVLAGLPLGLLTMPIGYRYGQQIGGDSAPSIAQLTGLPIWSLVPVFAAIIAVFLWGLSRVSQGWLRRLDEAESHIEMRALASTLGKVMITVAVLWLAGEWFPQANEVIEAWQPAILFAVYALAYFIIRGRLRRSLAA